MASFLSGLLSGGVQQSSKENGKLKGILKGRKKKGGPISTKSMAEGMAPEFKRGGRVRRTGLAKVHKGEVVLTKKQARGRRRKKR